MRTGSMVHPSSFRADHDVLAKLATEILATIVDGDPKRVPESISVLQAAVAAHLSDEEREILPRYAMHAPEDAARIVEEHAAIRKVLAQLDVDTDLHLVRAAAIASFLTAMKAHAAREDAGMYLWACEGAQATAVTL